MNLKSGAPKTIALLDQARSEVFPDYAVGVWLQGERFFHYAGCGQDSLFDLASLTKVLCTTTICLLAEQTGLLKISDPVAKFFPGFPDSRVALSHLLNHSSGLPAWLGLHSHFHDENGRGSFDPRKTPALARAHYEREILESFLSQEGAAKFEKQCVYSDLGFMLLGWALEKATGSPLDALFQEWLSIPQKLDSLQFLPTSPDVVPTEDCPWRGRVLRGEVHDDNTFVLGGVAGHAGLFGNTEDVIKAAELWMMAQITQNAPVLSAELARKYFSFTHVPGSTRVLGWDGVSRGSDGSTDPATASSSGQYFSDATRGHLGFTGTSLWIDPKKKLIVTLLTNRVHPSRRNEKIKQLRPVFHDSLLSELGLN